MLASVDLKWDWLLIWTTFDIVAVEVWLWIEWLEDSCGD